MTSILVLIALFFVAVLAKLATSHELHLKSISDCKRAWKDIDLRAATILFDPREDDFLRRNLPFHKWYKVKFLVTLAKWEYLSHLVDNTKLITRIGQISVREGRDTAFFKLLLNDALRLRIALARMQLKLIGTLLLPFVMAARPEAVFHAYNILEGRVAHTSLNSLVGG